MCVCVQYMYMYIRTFMAPEYGSASRKDAIMPFSESSALVDPNSNQGT